jgi:hypothetical protein
MAAKYLVTTAPTGAIVYMTVRRLSDQWLLNDFDGTFAAAPADPYILLTEVGVEYGIYEKYEDRFPWTDGMYRVAFYKQEGTSPTPSYEAPPLTSQVFLIAGDAIFTPLQSASDIRFLVAASIQSRRDLGAILTALTSLNNKVRSIESVQGSLAKNMGRY